ncbi:hypothetical protein N7456_002500 [Penicillium angulare]|uniref:Uncharacterized protein n=1 Tax=Penicillium angulare TaxID=116970 RepID=A0A9W9G8B0_9EURO|nr:hypothetical protein N7456_002500 [Penicillium angulare]
MYESTTSLDLHRLSRQSLQKRYESDEEDVSESDAGGPDFVPSLVGSQRAGTIDSDLSADENSHMDPDSDREDHLLAPCHVAKRPRPVSMDTVKRSSDATFVENTRVFDPEDDMVLELPLPPSPPELGSEHLFLQPAIYVSPNTPPAHHQRSRSPSPSSIFSLENAEIHVAKKITLMEPPTRPTLVFINSLGSRSKGSRSRPTNLRPRGNARNRESRIFDGKLEGNVQVPRLTNVKPTSSPRPSELYKPPTEEPIQENMPTSTPQSAIISSVSDIPVLPYFPPSPKQNPVARPRPNTSGSTEKQFPTLASRSHHGRRPTDPTQRPPSTRSNSNSSVPTYSARSASPFPEEQRGYIPDYHSEGSGSFLSRTCSPASTAPSPPQQQYVHSSKRGPVPSSNGSGAFSRAPMMRHMTRKHSATSSIHSMASMRSEVDTYPTSSNLNIHSSAYAASSQPAVNIIPDRERPTRKSSQRRHGRHVSSSTGRVFMGLKLGKRAFNKV